MGELNAWFRSTCIFFDPSYLSLGVWNSHATRKAEQVKHLFQWNAQAMHQAARDKTGAPDTRPAVDDDRLSGEQVSV